MVTGMISLGYETNVSDVSDHKCESHGSARVTRGYAGPPCMDRKGTVNLKNQKPKFFVFTWLFLQVMSSHCKKIQFSVAQSYEEQLKCGSVWLGGRGKLTPVAVGCCDQQQTSMKHLAIVRQESLIVQMFVCNKNRLK